MCRNCAARAGRTVKAWHHITMRLRSAEFRTRGFHGKVTVGVPWLPPAIRSVCASHKDAADRLGIADAAVQRPSVEPPDKGKNFAAILSSASGWASPA
jgi:hypothetical protein